MWNFEITRRKHKENTSRHTQRQGFSIKDFKS